MESGELSSFALKLAAIANLLDPGMVKGGSSILKCDAYQDCGFRLVRSGLLEFDVHILVILPPRALHGLPCFFVLFASPFRLALVVQLLSFCHRDLAFDPAVL